MTIMSRRFRGFFPVVVDIETGGFNAETDAMLEIAAVVLSFDDRGKIHPKKSWHFHVHPFEGANIDKASLEFTGIDPDNPLRGAVSEKQALSEIFTGIRELQKEAGCQRSVMVAHNAHFDMGFLNAASERIKAKRNPFHPFTMFDTATLAGVALGQTVLAKACEAAQISFDNDKAHSALYDAQKTAELFCYIVNRWKALGGWPLGD
ncbi:MAG: ribonuclease T [Gammaproteobacteria bacterium]|nr:ribonuclease T [Gammaproteobacteria bacterium]MDH5629566.1 ribonuclease T [Gammaproteobacteria bacterium]